ncbi:MAG: chemotaxis protein CheW [Enterobacterales bacterium]|nr:chemotaxis protein CheW [Enterobacterales bacterium]
MKLKKPTVTEPQTELESYVASMLVDSSRLNDEHRLKDEKFLESNRDNEKPVENNLSRKKSNATIKSKNKDQSSSIRLITSKQEKKNPSHKKADKGSFEEVASVIKQSITEEQQPKSINLLSPKSIKSITPTNTPPVVIHETNKITNTKFLENNDIEKDPRLKNVEKLLSQIALAKIPQATQQVSSQIDIKGKSSNEQSKSTEQGNEIENRQLIAAMESSFEHRENTPLKEELGSVFQTLVFEVNQLPMAVPLVKLGGIVDLAGQDITPLVGTPDWFLGLVPNERGNLLVVDTQRFLMPEREQADQPDYRFLIVLDNSQWAIACHSVDDAKNLSPDDIRWSSRNSKRPWFAGMVVEYMSALIEVDELINMLADNIVE